MDSTDICNQIGALELGAHQAGLDDGVDDAVLEAAGADPEVAPSSQQGSCVPTLPPLCR
jgi:hypothetical protein